MLTTRESRLLELLYRNPRVFTTSELSLALGISTRTVKSDIKQLGSILRGHGCLIEAKAGLGMRLCANEKGRAYLDALMEKPSQDLGESRKYRVALAVLESDGFISMEQISQSLFVSKSTVVNDVDNLEPLIAEYRLELIKRAKYGIRISGEESHRRAAYGAVLQKLLGQSVWELEQCAQYFPISELRGFDALLREIEREYDLRLSDVSARDLVLQMAVMARRIRMGGLAAGAIWDHIPARYEMAARHLIGGMEGICATEIPEGEVGWLAMHLMGAQTEGEAMGPLASRQTTLRQALIAILKELGTGYGFDFASDENLVDGLLAHLRSVLVRLELGTTIQNPYAAKMKQEFSFAFELAALLLSRLTQGERTAEREDEVSYIAMHIAAFFEREKTRRRERRVNIAIVCATGIGTSQLLRARVENVCGNVTVRQMLSASKVADTLNRDEVDLVLTTVPLQLEGVEVLRVSPLLGEQDVSRVGGWLVAAQQKNALPERECAAFLSFLREDITILQCDCRSREEALRAMAQRMIEQGYAEKGYLESVLEREQISSTAIGRLFAIPHAFGGHIRKPGIGFMVMKKPVQWGEEKVQMLLMLGIDMTMQGQFLKLFSYVTDLVRSHTLVNQIGKTEHFSQLIKLLQEDGYDT